MNHPPSPASSCARVALTELHAGGLGTPGHLTGSSQIPFAVKTVQGIAQSRETGSLTSKEGEAQAATLASPHLPLSF